MLLTIAAHKDPALFFFFATTFICGSKKMTPYEQQRAANIAENDAKLRALGLIAPLAACPHERRATQRADRQSTTRGARLNHTVDQAERRSSSRLADKQVSYDTMGAAKCGEGVDLDAMERLLERKSKRKRVSPTRRVTKEPSCTPRFLPAPQPSSFPAEKKSVIPYEIKGTRRQCYHCGRLVALCGNNTTFRKHVMENGLVCPASMQLHPDLLRDVDDQEASDGFMLEALPREGPPVEGALSLEALPLEALPLEALPVEALF